MKHVLVIDDQDDEVIVPAFSKGDFSTEVSRDLAEALSALESHWPDVIVLDARFPRTSAANAAFQSSDELLKCVDCKCRDRAYPRPVTVLVSGHNEAAQAFTTIAEWLTEGRIDDVLPKTMANAGWDMFQAVLRHRIDSILGARPFRDVRVAHQALRDHGIITSDPAILSIWNVINRVAPRNVTVCISGETGVGKNKVARAIHDLSKRRGRKFVDLDSSIDGELLESRLFGHVRGAFTGAITNHTGYFESADGGTLFLDEIGNMPLITQRKILKAVEGHEIVPVGANRAVSTDVRLVTATKDDLAEKVRQGTFREDLYFRLMVVRIHIPPLRERPDDIDLLTDYFLTRFNTEERNNVRLTADVRRALRQHSWPGNVRELEHMLKSVVAQCEGQVDLEQLRSRLMLDPAPSVAPVPVRWEGRFDKGDEEEAIARLRTVLTTAEWAQFESLQSTIAATTNPAPIHCYNTVILLAGRDDAGAWVKEIAECLDTSEGTIFGVRKQLTGLISFDKTHLWLANRRPNGRPSTSS